MADKTAQIKLTLKSDGFKAGMADVTATEATDVVASLMARAKALAEGQRAFGSLAVARRIARVTSS